MTLRWRTCFDNLHFVVHDLVVAVTQDSTAIEEIHSPTTAFSSSKTLPQMEMG
jgi:hypothetical protein